MRISMTSTGDRVMSTADSELKEMLPFSIQIADHPVIVGRIKMCSYTLTSSETSCSVMEYK